MLDLTGAAMLPVELVDLYDPVEPTELVTELVSSKLSMEPRCLLRPPGL